MLKEFTAFLIKAATNYSCLEKVYVTVLRINFRNLYSAIECLKAHFVISFHYGIVVIFKEVISY